MIYSHYSLHKTTPILGVRGELGSFPAYIPAIQRLTNYMDYLSNPDLHPLAAKAKIVQQSIAIKSKFSWWNNAWRILNHFQVTDSNISKYTSKLLKEHLQGEYRRWWMTFLATPTNAPKLDTYRLFHTSFHTAPYLNTGPPYLRPWALQFRCSNHRLDLELGRHIQTPREQWTCRFCKGTPIGDEYHSFQCPKNMDLQVHCDIHVTSRPQFLLLMHSSQMYNATLTSLCPILKINNPPNTQPTYLYNSQNIHIFLYSSIIHSHS